MKTNSVFGFQKEEPKKNLVPGSRIIGRFSFKTFGLRRFNLQNYFVHLCMKKKQTKR